MSEPLTQPSVPGFFGVNHTAAVVQVKAWPPPDAADLLPRLERLAADAAERGARLIVFPEHAGTLVVGARLGMNWETLEQAVGNVQAGAVADPEGEVVRLFSPVAARLGCFICPGTVFVRADETAGVMNVSLLISPQGEVLLRQPQVHRTAQERALGLVPGRTMDVCRTDVATTGIVVGTDAWYPETGRCLALQGATVVVCPLAVQAPYLEWKRVAGLWKDVQANQFFALEACLTGQAFGMRFEGPSTIYATCEMTEGDTGVLARTSSASEDGIAASLLDFGRLRQTMRGFPVFEHLNPGLYLEHFPGLYERLVSAAPPASPSVSKAAGRGSGSDEAC